MRPDSTPTPMPHYLPWLINNCKLINVIIHFQIPGCQLLWSHQQTTWSATLTYRKWIWEGLLDRTPTEAVALLSILQQFFLAHRAHIASLKARSQALQQQSTLIHIFIFCMHPWINKPRLLQWLLNICKLINAGIDTLTNNSIIIQCFPYSQKLNLGASNSGREHAWFSLEMMSLSCTLKSQAQALQQ